MQMQNVNKRNPKTESVTSQNFQPFKVSKVSSKIQFNSYKVICAIELSMKRRMFICELNSEIPQPCSVYHFCHYLWKVFSSAVEVSDIVTCSFPEKNNIRRRARIRARAQYDQSNLKKKSRIGIFNANNKCLIFLVDYLLVLKSQ